MSRNTRLYLLRHGAVAAPWNGRVYGDLDVPLSPEGEAEARRAARVFDGKELELVVSSGLERAEYTAAAIRATARALGGGVLPRRDEPRLRELGRGEWAGKSPAELRAAEPVAWERFEATGWTSPPPGGETLEQLAARVLPTLDELAAACAGPVAIVAHKWVLRVAACEALGCPLRESPRLEVPTSGMLALDWPRDPAPAGPRAIVLRGLGIRELLD